MKSSIIEASQIDKSYRQRSLYSNVNFHIPRGTITGLIGPNGSGKSVLLRLMCGFAKPDSGSIHIDPEFLSKGRTFPDRFGVLIDRPGYMPDESGLDNLLTLAAIRKRATESELREMMTRLGLDPDLKQRMKHYSLGMKQKVALAQAFIEEPLVLLLDEPFNALDSDSAATVKMMIREFHEAGGTVVFTSHNPEDIRELSERIIRIENGTVTTDETATL